MSEKNLLADQFEANRAHLRRVAFRMLGSGAEAEDAVQEAWIRLSREEASEIDNLAGWLTTVVARICLDMLRTRRSRREDAVGMDLPEPSGSADIGTTPEQEAVLADAVGLAVMVVLQKLTPAERVAFVLHDMFDLPFDEIGPIVGRSSDAARQLASRARRRVRGQPVVSDADLAAQRKTVDAFLTAARNGDFDGLIAVLDPDVVMRTDAAAARLEGGNELRGAQAVAQAFKGRAGLARPALIDGLTGIVVAPRGRLLLVLQLEILNGRIKEISAIADHQRLGELDLAVFDA